VEVLVPVQRVVEPSLSEKVRSGPFEAGSELEPKTSMVMVLPGARAPAAMVPGIEESLQAVGGPNDDARCVEMEWAVASQFAYVVGAFGIAVGVEKGGAHERKAILHVGEADHFGAAFDCMWSGAAAYLQFY